MAPRRAAPQQAAAPTAAAGCRSPRRLHRNGSIRFSAGQDVCCAKLNPESEEEYVEPNKSKSKHSETFYRNPAGSQSRPVKAGRQPEANIASSSVMAARSVWSDCQSRVIEPRNNDRVGAFVVRYAGAAPRHCKSQVWRSDRGLRAGHRRRGFSGNLGYPSDSSLHNTGPRTTPVHQRPGAARDLCTRAVSEVHAEKGRNGSAKETKRCRDHSEVLAPS